MPGTRSSDPGRGPRPGLGRGVLWAVVVANALLGALLLVVAVGMLLGPEADRAWSVTTCVVVAALAIGWIAFGAVGFHRTYLHRPPLDGRHVVVTDVAGERAVVMPWRTTSLRVPLLSVLFFAVVLVGLAVYLLGQGNAGWWVPGILAVPVLLTLPDAVLRLRRRARLVLSPRGIGAEGWDGDAWLDWDDVQGIAFDQVGQATVIRVVGRDGAASWRFRRRPRVLHAAVPKGPWVDIPGPALEVEGSRLVEAITHYTRHPSARAELAGDAGRQRLVGTASPFAHGTPA